jgi:hypothetical protein
VWLEAQKTHRVPFRDVKQSVEDHEDLVSIKTCCALVIKDKNLNHDAVAAIKRQVPFLIGGTITGIIMTYFWGFLITLFVNSMMWYLISFVVYKLVWRKNGLTDQMIILRNILKKTKPQKSIQRAL